VFLCYRDNLADSFRPLLGSEGRSGLKMTSRYFQCGAGALARVWNRQQIRISLLNSRQTLGSRYHVTQALVVKLVRGGTSCSSAENRAHGNAVVFFSNILMNGVVGEPRKRRSPAVEKTLDLLRSRVFFDPRKDISSLILSQHLE